MSERCLTSIVFWKLRQALVRVRGVSRRAIKPSTPIADLIPLPRRRAAWSAISRATGLRLPGLEYPSWLTYTILLASLALPVVFFAHQGRFRWWWALIILVAIPSMATLLSYAAKPLAEEIPTHCLTLGEMARTVLGLNYGKLTREYGSGNPTELRAALRYAVIDATGADPSSVDSGTLLELVQSSLRSGV